MKMILLFLALAGVAAGQDQNMVNHRFLGWENQALLGMSAGAITADSLSTQKCLSHSWCHEVNPVARPFVQSREGQAAISGVAFVGEIGGMYLAHERGWYKMERIMPLLVIAVESAISLHNYRLH